MREEHPWDALRAQIVDQRGRIEVKAADLEGRETQHPLYRMMAILAKACGAVGWFNGAPLGPTHGAAYRIHSHHIFPTSALYKSGYDPENHLHRKVVNEIANRAFLTAETNLGLSSSLPEQYLPEVEKNYPGALVKQFIPMEPELWAVERYADFLQARREMMALKLNEYMASLVTEPEMVHERAVVELISLGESATLEFKSTLQWDMVENRVNKRLRYSVLKTIAAFLNSAGGTLVIGVEDDGRICGLSNDLKTTHHSRDKSEHLTTLIAERIGPQYSLFIRTRFDSIEENSVCVVDVDKAHEPVFVKDPGGSMFYSRFANTTRSLDTEEVVSYIQMNWE